MMDHIMVQLEGTSHIKINILLSMMEAHAHAHACSFLDLCGSKGSLNCFR